MFTMLSVHIFAQITPYITCGDKSYLLQEKSHINYTPANLYYEATITVDPDATCQTMDGFGGAMTEGSAESICALSLAKQDELLNELFNTSTGLGISVLRITIGASDLSSSAYSYNETSDDVDMNNFSLAGPDLTYLIPVLKKIVEINPNIKFLATPWSAPRWMKTVNNWKGGYLKSSAYTAYANYFIKYFEAMQGQGINIWAMTPQNEPENTGNYPSMGMTQIQQLNFINNYLGPTMNKAGYGNIKIIAFDHNCDNTTYPIFVCKNSSYVDGAAFHLYAGDISAMTAVKEATKKNIYFTEQYTAVEGDFQQDLGWHMYNVIIGAANNWAKVMLEWNLANNSAFGPNASGSSTNVCLGSITVNKDNTYTRNVSYYIIGQISKFVKPDAVRLGTTVNGTSVVATAFRNVDNSIVVLAYNGNSSGRTLKVMIGSSSFYYRVSGGSAISFVCNSTTQSCLSTSTTSGLLITSNLTQSEIALKYPRIRSGRVYVISSDGKEILEQKLVDSDSTNICTESLAAGIYLISIRSDNGILNSRFVKT